MEINNVNYGVKNHEKVGADYLRKLNFSEITCSLVENHINKIIGFGWELVVSVFRDPIILY